MTTTSSEASAAGFVAVDEESHLLGGGGGGGGTGERGGVDVGDRNNDDDNDDDDDDDDDHSLATLFNREEIRRSLTKSRSSWRIISNNNAPPSSSSSSSNQHHHQHYGTNPTTTITRIRRLTDFLGGLVVASAAFFLFHNNHNASSTAKNMETSFAGGVGSNDGLGQHHPSLLSSSSSSSKHHPFPSITTTSKEEEEGKQQLHHYSHATAATTGGGGNSLQSKYKQFQALGFQIYTGGAPAVISTTTNNTTHNGTTTTSSSGSRIRNPECSGKNAYGRADDYDQDDLLDESVFPSLTSLDLWQCYLGRDDPRQDVQQRLSIMRDAVERAYSVADNANEEILKIFIAPEFFWRGKDGAYVFYNSSISSSKEKQRHDEYFHHYNNNNENENDDCEEVCLILKGLEELVAQPKYKDWLFLFGTVIVSETLPIEDTYDYLFYNFAPVYRGYDPTTTDHYGKRYLVPKRYVSNIDFLTPVRQLNDTITRELLDITNPKQRTKQQQRHDQIIEGELDATDSPTSTSTSTSPQHEKSTTVHNPFELQQKFYDRDMWYKYKDELNNLGYTMIEYDWVILDNITFTIEVCLDHDVSTALKAYLADKVMGSPTVIPKNIEQEEIMPAATTTSKKKKHPSKHHHHKPTTSMTTTTKTTGNVEYVPIPSHQAQISLVSSSGMTINPSSMALTNNGTIILQDGLSSREGTMNYESECEHYSWHFAGGSEHISRSAKLTSTEISFEYSIHSGHEQVGIWDDLEDDTDTTWKDRILGVFTTEKYEPKITVYSPKDIAQV